MTDFVQDLPDGAILALDEMSLYFQATLTRVWAPVGQTPIADVHPARDQMHFYGALNVRDGGEVAVPSLEASAELTATFVMTLLMLYPQPMLLPLDRAPCHFGELTTLIDQTDRLQVMDFPPACPELNRQEHVGERTRDVRSHNPACRDFQSLLDDFETT